MGRRPFAFPKTKTMSRLGINLDRPVDFSPACPTIDAVKTARPFGSYANPADGKAPVDFDGWPKGDFGCVVHADVDNVTGTYKLSYSGTGMPSALWGARIANIKKTGSIETADDAVTADLIATGDTFGFRVSGAKNVHNVKLFRPGYTSDAGVFTRDFVASKSPFGIIRLMNWTRTNDTTVKKWEARAKVTDAQWSHPAKGAPWEPWLDYARALSKDLWLCLPHLADESYIDSLAKLCAERIGPAANVYLEDSNEIWNTQFIQGQALPGMAAAAGMARMPFHALRTIKAGEIFRRHLPAARVRPVLAMQFSNYGEAAIATAWVKKTYPNGSGLHAIAIAPYYANPGTPTATTPQPYADHMLTTAKRWQAGQGDAIATINKFAALAKSIGGKLVGYEGGPDLAPGGDAAQVAARAASQSLPGAGESLGIYLDTVFARGFDEFLIYKDFSPWNKSGYFGLSNQPGKFDGVKYKAAIAAAAKYPRGVVAPAPVPIPTPTPIVAPPLVVAPPPVVVPTPAPPSTITLEAAFKAGAPVATPKDGFLELRWHRPHPAPDVVMEIRGNAATGK